MALRDQPYLPLYIQDFLTDEKLIECSALATGVYIRLMCLMHKSEEYGTILLKQKDKQTDKQIKNFALKIAKQLPYTIEIIIEGLTELINEKVLIIEGDFLKQKRMVKDNSISVKRATSGTSGGKKTQEKNKTFASKFAKAKNKANTENEIEYVNEIKKERSGNLIFPFDSENFKKIWAVLVTQKKWKGKSFAALQMALKKLSQHTEQDAIEMIENTIAGEWQGIFELKKQNNTNGKQTISGSNGRLDNLLKKSVAILQSIKE